MRLSSPGTGEGIKGYLNAGETYSIFTPPVRDTSRCISEALLTFKGKCIFFIIRYFSINMQIYAKSVFMGFSFYA